MFPFEVSALQRPQLQAQHMKNRHYYEYVGNACAHSWTSCIFNYMGMSLQKRGFMFSGPSMHIKEVDE
jgi:hypothetical protein